ncbi:hypothetical protein FJY94_02915 [Candidatus Kaiserbacteria bacterium]|nr:hypothetical protein [Candidatus Kaiserbacteria bacterium]
MAHEYRLRAQHTSARTIRRSIYTAWHTLPPGELPGEIAHLTSEWIRLANLDFAQTWKHGHETRRLSPERESELLFAAGTTLGAVFERSGCLRNCSTLRRFLHMFVAALSTLGMCSRRTNPACRYIRQITRLLKEAKLNPNGDPDDRTETHSATTRAAAH